jgi:hypothetical protein
VAAPYRTTPTVPDLPAAPDTAATSYLGFFFFQVFRAEPSKEDVVLRIAAA